MEPLRHIHNPGFGAVIFRRTYPEITAEGSLWDESMQIYPLFRARPILGRLKWVFPSGAEVSFAHLQYEKDVHKYQGAQIPLICFDQLEHFSRGQFFYMLSRNRSMCGVRPYVRASCNPHADSWLAEFLAWWIADDGYADLAREDKLRWFVRGADERLAWADSPRELKESHRALMPKSVTFIPASVYDNKILLASNPEYLANLMALPLVDRERLLGDARRGGNWKVREEAGKVFNRGWFEIVDAVPAGGVECRFWDFAATKKEIKGKDPDYTASVKMRKVEGVYYIADCTAEQEGPAEVDRALRNLSTQDVAAAQETGTRYKVRWEMEPGAAGKRESYRLVKMLAGLDVGGVRPQGDKITRAKPLAAQAEAGNVKLLRGTWNEMWLEHMHNQPEIKHDDILDASSGSFIALVGVAGRQARGPEETPWTGDERYTSMRGRL